jgi:hypothetical protein
MLDKYDVSLTFTKWSILISISGREGGSWLPSPPANGIYR